MEWTRTIADDGTWLCEHTDQSGNPAPASVLNLAELEHLYTSPSNTRGELLCPGCGTLWRGWPTQRQVKFYIEWCPRSSSYPYQRAQQTDLDTLITEARRRFPGLWVSQYQYVWPADPDGVWWFSLPDITCHEIIQIETGDGMLPFYEDHRKLTTIQEAVGRVCNLLKKIKPPPPPWYAQ